MRTNARNYSGSSLRAFSTTASTLDSWNRFECSTDRSCINRAKPVPRGGSWARPRSHIDPTEATNQGRIIRSKIHDPIIFGSALQLARISFGHPGHQDTTCSVPTMRRLISMACCRIRACRTLSRAFLTAMGVSSGKLCRRGSGSGAKDKTKGVIKAQRFYRGS